ncbi:MAG: hypothetical protein KAG04_01145 [Mycoplasmataceae bacterium]|nr:hypothetical protein [Mycoplasmataceae bacterium]
MGFKDWAKRVQKEIAITSEEIAAGAVIALQDEIKIEVSFIDENRKMPKELHDQLVEHDRKFGRGAIPFIPPKNIKVKMLEQELPKYHELESKFSGNLAYSETRTQAKAALIASNALWNAAVAGIGKTKKGEYVEITFTNGSKMLDSPERLIGVINMDLNNSRSTLNIIDGYKSQQRRKTAAKHVDLSYGSLKKMWKKRK